MNSYNFQVQNKKGRKWEKRIIKFIKSKPETISVFDVSKDPLYQKKDIDIVWNQKDERGEFSRFVIDVKTLDKFSKYKKVFLETIANIEKRKLGKFLSSEADYWFYVSPKENTLYAIPTPEIKKWFDINKDKYPKLKNRSVTNRGLKSNESEGYLVPLADLLTAHPKAKKFTNFYKRNIWEKLLDRLS